jgi:4-hydroxy-tetrahydrodipicolinate synthase
MGLVLKDMLVANITPFTEKLEIDEDGLRSLIRYLMTVDGLGGIVCNAHAGEGATMTREERIRCIKIIREETKGRVPLVSGVSSASTKEAIEIALDAKENGCDGIMPCPPTIYAWFAAKNPEFAIAYHKELDKGANMPIIVFQYAAGLPDGYTSETLMTLCREIENVVAIKHTQFSSGLGRYVEDTAGAKSIRPSISNFVATTALLFYAGVMGGIDGSLTGFGNVAPVEIATMLKLIKAGDVAAARKIHEKMYPVARLVYGDPFVYLHTRYKEASALAGYIRGPWIRSPQLPMEPTAREQLKKAMEQQGFLHKYRF